jgi:hypothetical protein
MLSDIENGIVERLNTKLTGVTKAFVDKARSNLNLNLPIIDVIVGGGTFTSATMSQYKVKTQVFVVLTFKNLKSEADRRKGVYPILIAILLLLAGNKFGLKIDALAPKRLDNVTEEVEAKAGKIVFQIEFETGFVLTPTSDEELVDLLTVGLAYYLEDPANDDVADASDTVTLDQT